MTRTAASLCVICKTTAVVMITMMVTLVVKMMLTLVVKMMVMLVVKMMVMLVVKMMDEGDVDHDCCFCSVYIEMLCISCLLL